MFNIGDLIYDTKETFLEDKFKETPLKELKGTTIIDDFFEDDDEEEAEGFLVKKSYPNPISPSSNRDEVFLWFVFNFMEIYLKWILR